MAVFYNKERAKYGHLTGQVIAWPVPYEGVPDDAVNIRTLPAGYLKCDGAKYFAKDYPRLAEVCGTGSSCKFTRKNIDGTDFDNVLDNQFMVPDLGSKYPEPTSGANAGVYNNIRKVDDTTGTEKSRSGIGIDAEAAIGTTNVRVSYSGSINVPSQEVEIRGKPGWNYAGASHYTEIEAPEENSIHPHMHFSTTARSRLRAQPSILETDNDHPRAAGRTGLQNGSTINIDDWLNATRENANAPAASGQKPCLLLQAWNPNSGTDDTGEPRRGSGLGNQTIYYGGCIADTGTSTDPYMIGKSGKFEFGCINKVSFTVNRNSSAGSPDGSQTSKFHTSQGGPFGICLSQNLASGDVSSNLTVPPTYIAGAPGMPKDYNQNELLDVVPLQAEDLAVSKVIIPDVENQGTDTADISIPVGTLPTAHSHRVRLDKGDHSYKVKTQAVSIDPENLETTFDVGVDQSISIDSATQPFIVMEYLIKI